MNIDEKTTINLGELGVKKPNEVEYLSQDEYKLRWKIISHAKRDIVWWAENFFHIVNMTTGLELIKLYPKQKELLEFITNNNRIITLASRQTGKTTTYTIFCLWYAMYFCDKKIMICSNKLQTSTEICQRIARAYENIPKGIKPGVKVYNKNEITFSNGSTIKGFATGSSSARGFSGNCIIIDEMAFIQPNIASDFFASVMPVISSAKNSKAIIVSTPNGKANLFYEIWHQANSKEAKLNQEGWKPFRIDWWDTGGIRDEKWKEQQIQSIGIQRWNVEFGNQFLDSTTITKLIPEDITEKFRMRLSEYRAQGVNQGKDLFVTSKDGQKNYVFRMYSSFDPDRTYLASADIAEGVGKDSSVLYIWDVTDLSDIRMCLKFSDSNVSVTEFAYICNRLLGLYDNPFLACESNGISLGFIEQLRVTYEYQNFVRLNKENGCGIDSHVQVKSRACLWMRDMMTTMGFDFGIYDPDLVEEFTTFAKKNTSVHNVYAAIGDNHDDHLMSFVWLCWILNPENVDRYYVVVDNFTSSLGNIYPKILQPYYEYLPSEIYRIMNDPITRDFQYYLKTVDMDKFRQQEFKQEQRRSEMMKALPQSNMIAGEPERQIVNPYDMVKPRPQPTDRMTVNERILTNTIARRKEKYNPDEINTQWSQWKDNGPGGIDSVFGFDDDDDGKSWNDNSGYSSLEDINTRRMTGLGMY